MCRPLCLLLVLCTLLSPLQDSVQAATAAAAPTEPVIRRIAGRVVLVQVPEGYASVHLQRLTAPPKGRPIRGRTPARPQWVTVAAKRTTASAGYVRLVIPTLTPLRYLRVYGLRTTEVPASLLTGVSTFGPDELSPAEYATPSFTSIGNGLMLFDTAVNGGTVNFAMANSVSATSSAVLTPTRTVSESDIWKVQGDRLYFFNSSRGLQTFDIRNPDDPALLGTLRLRGSGEEMYLLDDTHLVLLTNDNQRGGWSWSGPSNVSSGGGGIIRLGGGVIGGGIGIIAIQPAVIGGGLILNAAVLNNANANVGLLDVAGEVHLELGNQVAAPVDLSRFGILFGGASAGSPNDDHSVVIAEVKNGAPAKLAQIAFKGALRESRLVGKVLYLCTYTEGQAGNDSRHPSLNVISIDLSDPANPRQRGQVSFDGSEAAIYATDRYFFVAPAAVTISTSVYSTYASDTTTVHIVDISDPRGTISKAGQISVRGFIRDKFKMNLEGNVFTAVGQASTPVPTGFNNSFYSSPVSVVSTFSLANARSPVALGTLEVAPGEALFATRYVGTRLYLVTTTPDYIDPLAIIDLSNPRTPTIIGELHVPGYSTYIEPIGDRLVTTGMQNHTAKVEMYDVSNPAAPTQISSITLGMPESGVTSEAITNEKAFAVLPEENLILLPTEGWDYQTGSATGVQIIDLLETGLVKRGRIAASVAPRRVTVHRGRIVSISSTKLVSVNATNRDQPVVTAEVDISWSVDRVIVAGQYLLELQNSANNPELSVALASQPDVSLGSLALPKYQFLLTEVRGDVLYVLQRDPTAGKLIVLAIDIAHLPKLTLLGHVNTPGISDGFSEDVQSLWVNDRTLLLTARKYQSNMLYPALSAIQGNIRATDVIGYFPTRSRQLLAVDVTAPTQPKFASTLDIGENRAWTVSAPVAANDTVYLSYKVAPRGYYVPNGATLAQADSEQADVNKHFLKQIDYADSAHPIVSEKRVSLPGELRAVSRGGGLLFTVGDQRNPATGDSLKTNFALQASSFDGNSAHLLNQIPLASASQPFAVSAETVFLLDPQPVNTWVANTSSSAPNTGDAGGNLVLFNGAPLQLSTSVWAGGGSYQPNSKKSSLATWQLEDDGTFVQRDKLTLDHEVAFRQFGGLTVLRGEGPTVHFVDTRDPLKLNDLGAATLGGVGSSSLECAGADLTRGLWLPLGSYGLEYVPIAP